MVQIDPSSDAGQFLISQGVTEAELTAATFRSLNWQAGDALTVIWPWRRSTIFIRSRFIETNSAGELAVDRRLALVRHELHHVKQGRDWGFIGYWARHLWARVRHLSISAKQSSVEAPAYGLQREAQAALQALAAAPEQPPDAE